MPTMSEYPTYLATAETEGDSPVSLFSNILNNVLSAFGGGGANVGDEARGSGGLFGLFLISSASEVSQDDLTPSRVAD